MTDETRSLVFPTAPDVTLQPAYLRSETRGCFTLKRVIIGLLILLTVAVALTLVIVLATRPVRLYNNVKATNIMTHLKELEAIAYQPHNHGSRSIVNGYADSAQYIIEQLQEFTDCNVTKQEFHVPVYDQWQNPTMSQTYPMNTAYQFGVDFGQHRYGGSGQYSINANVFPVSNYGCSSNDYIGFPAGAIALLRAYPTPAPDGCTLVNQVRSAELASAVAVIIHNEATRTILSRGRILNPNAGYLDGDFLAKVPVLSASYAFGQAVREISNMYANITLSITSNTTISIVPTFNILCTTLQGDAANTVVAGAHLDSVPEGPGINDNGSGSSSLLEIVLQLYRSGLQPKNRVIFAWWGAEEIGLMGSYHFVQHLKKHSPEEFAKIKMALNFDMLGAPNYIPEIHNLTLPGSPAVSHDAEVATHAITNMFKEYFGIVGKPYTFAGMNGGSDYYPFLQAGVPAGGLATGAGSLKTAAERTTFGGFANAAYDPCYHQPCDTTENISQTALELMADAAAFVIQKVAMADSLADVLSVAQ